mmetsp:Transcript_26519/g.23442  ORF Transcript_26519/g.23442 Transcript_26519/m.23442 type:complete len:117 (+) Transcript_26519:13-363(+)
MGEIHYGEKKRILNNVLIHLLKLSKKYKVCIILINTLKSGRRFNDATGENKNKLEANFGEALFQSVTNRVHIDRDSRVGDDMFMASLTKGSIFYDRMGSFEMHYMIKESGVSAKIE